MLMTRANKETIVLTIENTVDYLDLFDNGVEDEISFDLNAEVLDVFFPDWDTYIDEDSPFESLRMEDIHGINTIQVLISEDIPIAEGLEGEGMYDVLGGECYLLTQDSETGEDRNFKEFLDFTGTVTFKINKPIKHRAIQLSTEVTEEDIANGVKDEFGAIYSSDGKRLLRVQYQDMIIESYCIKPGTQVICDYAFMYCKKLTHIAIPNTVSHIGDRAFHTCVGLNDTTIPDSVIHIGDGAFSFCSSLTSIIIPNSVEHIGKSAFLGCSILNEIQVSDSNKTYDSRQNCNAIIHTATNSLIAGSNNTIIPNSVTDIGNGAFSFCEGITGINIPESVAHIGDSAFTFCKGLTSITIPNTVTHIKDGTFSFCGGLTSISIPNSVVYIGKSAFMGCDHLPSVNLPNSVKYIGEFAFIGCGALEKIQIPVGTYDKFKELLPDFKDKLFED